jgi:hypothetical protein
VAPRDRFSVNEALLSVKITKIVTASTRRAARQGKSRKKLRRFARPARSPQVVPRKGLNAGAGAPFGNPLKNFPTPAVKTVASP